MLFNSLEFLIFFPVVTILFFVLPHNFRWALLLTASCIFYMFFKPVYILILFFTIIIDYFAGIYLERIQDKNQKLKFLVLSIVANVGVLAIFKYYNFINVNITGLGEVFGFENKIPYLDIILPIGLSFHTFQAMSYTIEVYRGHQPAERNFGIYALYVMFYPQLVAGPIERPQNLLHQFYEVKKFDYERVVSGLRFMLWGFFKKVVIADNLALVVNQVYNSPAEEQNGLTYLVATYFFAFQIYCDFSGYSDIAIGAARVMGFNLMNNFRQPYLSKSIREFWSRWHISLSTWFRDYVYIPLGGNRTVKWKWYYNLFITFLISGLWHGANWTFIIWGALHGIYLLTGDLFGSWFKKSGYLINAVKIIVVFHLVTLAWIFFRADNVHAAVHILREIAHVPVYLSQYFREIPLFNGLGEYSIITIIRFALLIFGLVVADWLSTKKQIQQLFFENAGLRWTCYFIMLYGIIFGGYFGLTKFIYFQF